MKIYSNFHIVRYLSLKRKVRTLRQANLTSEMDKCELNEAGLSEVRWPGKGEIVSGNYTMFYSGGVKAEKKVLQYS